MYITGLLLYLFLYIMVVKIKIHISAEPLLSAAAMNKKHLQTYGKNRKIPYKKTGSVLKLKIQT